METKKILWLEDEPSSISIVKNIIEKNSGLEIVVAETVSEAFAAISSHKFAITLIDISVPSGNIDVIPPAFRALFSYGDKRAGARFYDCLNATTDDSQVLRGEMKIRICTGHDYRVVVSEVDSPFDEQYFLPKSDIFLRPQSFCGAIFEMLANSFDVSDLDSTPEPSMTNLVMPQGHNTEKDASIKDHGAQEEIQALEDKLHDIRNLLIRCSPLLRNIESTLSRGWSGRTPDDGVLPIQTRILNIMSSIDRQMYDLPEAATSVGKTLSVIEDSIAEIRDIAQTSAASTRGMVLESTQTAILAIEKDRRKEFAIIQELFKRVEHEYAREDFQILSEVIHQCVSLSHLVPLNHEANFNSSSLLSSQINFFQMSAAAKNVRIEPEIQSGIFVSTGNADAFRKIINNILDNAVKYTRPMRAGQSWITVKHYRRGTYAVSEFESWGKPLSDEEIDILNKRNGRLESSSAPGNGFGLRIVREQLDLFGGELKISKPSKDRTQNGRPSKNARLVFEIRIPIGKFK